MNPEDILESHVPTPAELALMVKALREERKWTQATLAELAGINERTIQRVEDGLSVSLDTRRAIARGFGIPDLDIFDKPFPFPNIEKLKQYIAELDKTTKVVALTRIESARTLRTMIERSESTATDELGDIPSDARESFAELVDYLRDYNDIHEEYSMTDRLGVDRDIDELLKTISDNGAAVGAGLRDAKIGWKSDAPGTAPMDWSNLYIILAPHDMLPSNIRVAKQIRFGS